MYSNMKIEVSGRNIEYVADIVKYANLIHERALQGKDNGLTDMRFYPDFHLYHFINSPFDAGAKRYYRVISVDEMLTSLFKGYANEMKLYYELMEEMDKRGEKHLRES